MSSTKNALGAACQNPPACSKAVAGEVLEWYPGAGEYCPECGEALMPLEHAFEKALPSRDEPPGREDLTASNTPPTPAYDARPTADGPRNARFKARRWFWILAGVFIAGAAVVYAGRRLAPNDHPAPDVIAVCPIPSAQQLAADLVSGYASKSATPASRFVLANATACDVRFSTAPETPDAIIARDGIVVVVNPLNPVARISEKQLRAIFDGSIRDWSELGGSPGAIVPVLPDARSDEAHALASSLFFGIAIDRGVRRSGSSADVTRLVAGANRTSRNAIGLVAFSQAVPAKVIRLAYLPPPSALSIATRRYPYDLTIAIEPESAHASATAAGLVDFAHSKDGAAIIVKNGLVAQAGL